MKSNIEKVYSKLPKTELSEVELATQKVELGLVDDLFKNVKSLDKKHRKELNIMEMALINYRKSYGKYENEMKTILTEANSLSSEKSKMEQQIKELGIQPKSVDGFFESGDMIVDIEQIIKNKEKFFTKPSIS